MSKGRIIKKIWEKGKEVYDERTNDNNSVDIGDPDVETPEVDSDGGILESISEFLGDILS